MIDEINRDQIQKAIEDYEDRINKANSLSFMQNTDGWSILLDTFEDMKDAQLHELAQHNPGDKESVLAAHAVWFSTVHTLNNILDAVAGAIRSGESARMELANLVKSLQMENDQNESIP